MRGDRQICENREGHGARSDDRDRHSPNRLTAGRSDLGRSLPAPNRELASRRTLSSVPARLRLTLVIVAACAVGALAGVVAFGHGDAGGGPTGRETGLDGALLPPGVRAADFRLHDQDGRLATMRAYRGRDVVVTFMYSTCPDTCPLTAQQIRGALDQLGRAVPVLAISVDPRADTPAHVRRFLAAQRMAGRMRYLTGTSAELAPVWRAYGIQPQGTGFTHTAATLLVDATGLQRVGYTADQLTPEALAHDLRALAAAR
jgi:protein SCO1